jgi:hypothetical protein
MFPGHIKGNHLAGRVDPGISSPGPINPNIYPGNFFDCFFDFSLNGPFPSLNLIPKKIGAVIFNQRANATLGDHARLSLFFFSFYQLDEDHIGCITLARP